MRIACLQISANADWRRNLDKVQELVRQALRRRAEVIALPEVFYYRGPASRLNYLARQVTPHVIGEFKNLAAVHHTAFLLGSVYEKSPYRGKYFNTSILISEQGEVVARYRKIHLFDISMKGKAVVRESRHVASGKHIACGNIFGIPVGLTVCYDLRFPELFRTLSRRGCHIIFVPSNFTYPTGKAHWEVLLRARAIENQVFIVAPAQTGRHPETGIRSFGTSLVVDPWGTVLARGRRHGQGVVMASLDFGFLGTLRRSFPVLEHRRLF